MEKGSDKKAPVWCGLERRRAFGVLGVGVAAVALALVLGLTIGLLGNRDPSSSETSDPSIPRANLGYALYGGTLVGDGGGVAQYLGIQYAKAPVGDLRFRAPVAPDARWTGREVKADKVGWERYYFSLFLISLSFPSPAPLSHIQLL
ncbi:hypothetical protein F4678DRAFT_138048 [Xylaria arbuscula]|nr:hypothetical protein F4678DRAFT_138048 [Xylaria arbuscula]